VFNIFYIGFSTWLQHEQGKRFTDNQAIWERLTEKAMASCQPKIGSDNGRTSRGKRKSLQAA
jgi:hypothetical protein